MAARRQTVLEELRVLYPDLKAAGRERHWAWLVLLKFPKPIPSDIQKGLFQLGHTSLSSSTTP